MNTIRGQSLWTSAILLIVLVGLTFGLVTSPPATPQSHCGENSAIPVLPLGVTFPGFELYSYGRSVATLAPGDGLCLALVWKVYVPGVLEDTTLQLEAVDPEGKVVATTVEPIVSPTSSSQLNFRVIQILSLPIPPGTAPGRHNLVVTLFDANGFAVSHPITISVVQITQ